MKKVNPTLSQIHTMDETKTCIGESYTNEQKEQNTEAKTNKCNYKNENENQSTLVKFAIMKTMIKWLNVVNVKIGYIMNALTYHLIYDMQSNERKGKIFMPKLW